MLVFPVLDEIPCLLKENALLAAHLLTDYNTYKATNAINIPID
jgi:hypothetical protein